MVQVLLSLQIERFLARGNVFSVTFEKVVLILYKICILYGWYKINIGDNRSRIFYASPYSGCVYILFCLSFVQKNMPEIT